MSDQATPPLRSLAISGSREYGTVMRKDSPEAVAEYCCIIDHLQGWIHSGDRATDKELQVAQLGRNVCEGITEYCDQLRADNARLRTAITSALESAEEEGIHKVRGTDEVREWYGILSEALKPQIVGS